MSCARLRAASAVLLLVAIPGTISTSFISGGGFMKCRPMTFGAREVADAMRVIEMLDVLLARMAWGGVISSSMWNIAFLTFSSSDTASTTKSAPSRACAVPRTWVWAVCGRAPSHTHTNHTHTQFRGRTPVSVDRTILDAMAVASSSVSCSFFTNLPKDLWMDRKPRSRASWRESQWDLPCQLTNVLRRGAAAPGICRRL
mmetsp:Transcript_45534/g.144882  ORF Transcript_45534/g.144882 Transcript_45534/m.144882 type:complete len:200 (+) Transcript_45534:59-658(+)